jgi:hypothetical protein
MRKGLAVVVLVGALATLASGCLFDRSIGYRPARFNAGPTVRAFNVPVAPSDGAPTTTASRTIDEPDATQTDRLSAASVGLQFVMQTALHTYMGGEIEAGRLEAEGSNFSGAYWVIGGEHAGKLGSIGAELASGWRGIKPGYGADTENELVFEPRVRGQLWIAEQWTIGAAAGARLGGGGDWMAGVYLGVHSHAF